ncbi:DUF167 domain-containing protein [Phosphitispora fastidiosa]|uniref:DUF167 domain-containing protein n=1 Tax=Phosphitispora fastidiosa TaxID=2837202 RepID=UPI001E5C49F7|nr:DUF167 domain-containing protein [Phosphitispora fastidiosa]MBU7008585.1 hypothetical protein [Phosphitispora fastidiosa]
MDIQEHSNGTAVKVKIQPRASRNRIAGELGDMLKVTLTAPPVDGAANAACIEFFASLLKIPKKQVEILSGHTGRTKLIKFYGVTKDELQRVLGVGD